MRKISSFRIFRILICLVLICCILVNSSPIKAEAVVAEGIATASVLVPAATVVAGILIVLGVMAASDHTTFNEVVNNCVTWLSNTTSYVVNGMINVIGYRDADAVTRAYVMKDLIQAIWGWTASSQTVSYGSFAPTSSAFTDQSNSAIQSAASARYAMLVDFGNSKPMVVKANSPLQYTLESGTTYIITTQDGSGFSIFYQVSSINWVDVPIGRHYCSYGSVTYFGKQNPVYYADGLILGQYAGPYDGTGARKLEETEEYADYASEVIIFAPPNLPDDDDTSNDPDIALPVPYLPVGIPTEDYTDDTVDQSQEEAQEGNTGIDFDFETSTDSNPDPGTNPDVDPNPGTNSGTSSWTPPSDMGKFTLDLKQYFPFCIPFDLYAFFTCLNAEPVAPVIEWIIPLPGGKTYPFEIDLSAFDSVAQILRRMQLLLFCVGLAFKTRDLIKG